MKPPIVSIILPTYNRARFLPQALASIRAQEFTDWELIVVDDGSTDETQQLLPELMADLSQPVRVICQDNQGPAGARNHGIDVARGKYLAFFDSDDVWLSHHLKQSVIALDSHAEVDWVFAASMRVDYETKRVLIENTFHERPELARFLNLAVIVADDLRIIHDDNLRSCGFRGSGMGGLQTSVVRRQAFGDLRFDPLKICEDRIVLIRAIDAGVRFAYFDDVHVLVYTHSNNTSFAQHDGIESRTAAFTQYVAALESIRLELPRTFRERLAINARLANEYFWSLAYPLEQRGEREEALRYMRLGLRFQPYDWRLLKTYLATVGKKYWCRARAAKARP